MKHISMMISIVTVAVSLTVAAAAQTASPPQPPAPGLAEVMLVTQTRHAKLWLAGNAKNWELADYQIEELKEGLEDVVKFIANYKGIAVGPMTEATMLEPISEVEGAIKSRVSAKFVASFDKLTAACNRCHVASSRDFIVIQRPGTSSFSNQSFAPKRR